MIMIGISHTWSLLLILQGLFLIFVLLFLMALQLEEMACKLQNKWYQISPFERGIRLLTYISVAVSFIYLWIIGLSIVLLGYWKLRIKKDV